MATPIILRCPVEVIRLIISELRHSAAALSSLSRTCKYLGGVVQPILFQDVSDYLRPKFDLVSILRTLTLRSDLAAAVKSINVADIENDLSPDKESFFRKSALQLGLMAFPGDWREIRTLVLELILARTPNVKTLSLPIGEGWHYALLPALTRKDNSPVAFWPKLEKLTMLFIAISNDNFEMSQISPLLWGAPALRELSVSYVEVEDRVSRARFPLGNLHSLELHSCGIFPETLAELVACCGPLERFSLWGVRPLETGEDEELSVIETWKALEPKKASLKFIEMDVDWPWEPRSGNISSLRHFERLETLVTHSVALEALRLGWVRTHPMPDGSTGGDFLVQLLPTSIKEVTFTNLDSNLWECVLNLAQAKTTGRLPNLRKVTLRASLQWGRYWDERPGWVRKQPVLDAAFERADLKLEIGKYARG